MDDPNKMSMGGRMNNEAEYWRAMLVEANGLLRSCYQVVDRERENPDTTNWYALRKRLSDALEKQHAALYPAQASPEPDTEEEDTDNG